MQKTGKKEILELVKRYFSGRLEIKFAYLFGSHARGTANKLSDVDIAVFIDKSMIDEEKHPYGYKASVIADLMQVLNTNEVDLVVLNDAPYILRHRVLRYGELAYLKDGQARIDFQFDTMTMYPDIKQLLMVHYGR